MRGQRLPKWPITPDHPAWPTCKCGCGRKVGARKKGSVKTGTLPGQPYEYARGHTARHALWCDGLKRCTACGEYKPSEQFNGKRNGSRGGLSAKCKTCLAAVNEAWRVANREAWLESQRLYAAKHSARKSEQARLWREANPERAAANGRRTTATRRARRHDAFVEHVDAFVVLERDDGICGICGLDVDPFDFHVDHIVPLSRGGEHRYGNVQVAHPACNQRKHAKLG